MASKAEAVEKSVETPKMDAATAEFLERVQNQVGEETARQRFERVQKETKEFLSGLKSAVKEQDTAAKNKVVDEVILPAFQSIVAAAEEFTGLTVRRLSLRYTNLKDQDPEYKVSHTINKARAESEDSNEA